MSFYIIVSIVLQKQIIIEQYNEKNALQIV